MDGILREAVVDSFMEVTSCGSQLIAVRLLDSCGWQLEAAINRYFTTGAADPAPDPPVAARSETMHDDTVRDPIPARSSTLYGNENLYAAGSSTARSAPSIWSADRARPSPWSVQRPAPMEYTTGWGSDGDTGTKENEDMAPPSPWSSHRPPPMEHTSMPEITATGWESDGDTGTKENEEINIIDQDERMKVAEEDNKEAMDEEDDYSDYNDQDDDGAYLESAETDSNDGRMESLESQPGHQTEKTLDELFRPPYEIMYDGSFHDAKAHAASEDRWLLVNLQSNGDFKSHQHNRDLWSNEVVVQVIKDNFIFSLLEMSRREGNEGLKVCCYYNVDVVDDLPAVLVVDPVTGQLLHKWCGLVQQPDDFLTSIGKFTESKPSLTSKPKIVRRAATIESGDAATTMSNTASSDAQPATMVESSAAQEPAMPNAAASDAQPTTKVEYSSAQDPAPAPKVDTIEPPPAPKVDEIDEPAMDGGQPIEGEAVCKLRVRFPAGNMVTKEFGSTRRIAVLFAYCRSVVLELTGSEQAFRIMRLAGRAYEQLLDDGASFNDLKLNHDTILVLLDT
ncbi:hypothetical protein ZWY2020_021247 [Hordeum vulgare]|nr:hypothetical protein ZWY2020_021247 [Hordeum vulgare]